MERSTLAINSDSRRQRMNIIFANVNLQDENEKLRKENIILKNQAEAYKIDIKNSKHTIDRYDEIVSHLLHEEYLIHVKNEELQRDIDGYTKTVSDLLHKEGVLTKKLMDVTQNCICNEYKNEIELLKEIRKCKNMDLPTLYCGYDNGAMVLLTDYQILNLKYEYQKQKYDALKDTINNVGCIKAKLNIDNTSFEQEFNKHVKKHMANIKMRVIRDNIYLGKYKNSCNVENKKE